MFGLTTRSNFSCGGHSGPTFFGGGQDDYRRPLGPDATGGSGRPPFPMAEEALGAGLEVHRRDRWPSS